MSRNHLNVEPDMGVGGVLSTAVSLVTDDFRIAGLQLAGAFAGLIPFVGVLIQFLFGGLALQFADESLGNPDPERSLLVRAVLALITFVILVIVVAIGLVALILPGIYLALRLSLALPAVWVGDMGPIDALKDSWSRASGHLLTILGVNLVFLLIAAVTLGPATATFVPLSSPEALQQFNQQPLILASPALFAVQTLYAVTVGAALIATQAIMFRSFGTHGEHEETEQYGTETEF